MLDEVVRVTLNSKTPFIATALYLLYTATLNRKFKNVQSATREIYSGLTLMMVAHNLIMSIFSFVVFKNSFFILMNFYKEFGLRVFVNDPSSTLKERLWFYIWVFYVSKYVEILDTIIIHMNSKRTSFLQMYHHAGAIICCWMLCIADSHVSWIFVVLNSFVHTFMYLYYCMATLRIPTRFKKTITYLQITQFVIGTSMLCAYMAFGHIFSKDPSLRSFQCVVVLTNLVYVGGLFVMFQSFAKKTYSKEKAKSE